MVSRMCSIKSWMSLLRISSADKERAILRRTGLPTSHILRITSTNHPSLRSVAGQSVPAVGIASIGHRSRCNSLYLEYPSRSDSSGDRRNEWGVIGYGTDHRSPQTLYKVV